MSGVTRGDDGFVREDPVDTYRMPLMDHLRELRRRLITSLIALGVSCMAAFVFAQDIWEALVAPMNKALRDTGRGTMAMTNPIEGVMTYMRIAVIAGITVASPLIFYQIWRFVAPGLYPKEQRLVLPLVIGSTTMFLTGIAFCYFVVFPFAFPFMLTVTPDSVQAVVSMDNYLDVSTLMLLAFGICFQLPVVVYLLSVIGLVNHTDMIRFFRYSMVGIAVVAAVITPSTDILNQMLLIIPLTALYVLSIGVSYVFSTKKPRPPEEKAEAT